MYWRAGENNRKPTISNAYANSRQSITAPVFNGLQDKLSKKSAMSRYAAPSHKSVARMVGYVLTLGDEASWWEFSALLMMRLDTKERVALAYAALNALDDDDARLVAEASLYGIVSERLA